MADRYLSLTGTAPGRVLPQPAQLHRWSAELPTLTSPLLHLTAGKSTLAEVHAALHPVVRTVATSGRILALGAPFEPADHHQSAAHPASGSVNGQVVRVCGQGLLGA